MIDLQTLEVCLRYTAFTRKKLHQKGYSFLEKNIGRPWFSRNEDVIEFTFKCDTSDKIEILNAQIKHEQEEQNKPTK